MEMQVSTDDAVNNSTPVELDYGLFGKVIYDEEAKEWTSTRDLHHVNSVTPAGAIETCLAGSLPPSAKVTVKASSRSKSVRQLVQDRPEFQAGASCIYKVLSEDLVVNLNVDNFTSGLIAFGRAQHAHRSSSASGEKQLPTCPIVAVPTGSHRDKICILKLTWRKETWPDKQDLWLDSFDLKEDARGIWDGDGGIIRQICAATADNDTKSLLAVRTPASIHLLRPLYSPDLVDARHMLSLQMPSQVDAECVDMTFNPQNAKQLAAVDSRGRYVIWGIQDGNKYCQTSITATNRMLPKEWEEGLEKRKTTNDGWHRIAWIRGGEVLSVCNRTHLECFNTSGQSLGSRPLVEQHSQVSWILDARESPSNDNDLFVVTTQSWTLLRISVAANQASFDEIISWKHHRDVNDLSLRITFAESSKDLRLLLYSRYDALISEYCIALEKSLSIMARGPPTRCEWHGTGIEDLHFVKLPFHLHQGGRSSRHWSQGATFWLAVALGSDLSLKIRRFHDTYDVGDSITWPTWTSTESNNADAMSEDSFGIAVDSDYDERLSGIDDPTFLADVHIQGRAPQRSASAVDTAYSVPNETVSETLEELMQYDTMDINKVLENAKELSRAEVAMLQTLTSSIPKPLKVDDLDIALQYASSLIKKSQESAMFAPDANVITPVASPVALRVPELDLSDDVPSMTLFYERLLAIYNRHLPSDVLGKSRLSKEKIVRQVSGSMFLASLGIRKSSSDQESIISPQNVDALGTQDSIAAAQQPHVPGKDPLEESLGRLSKYTRVRSRPADTNEASPGVTRTVSEITSHWTLHGDPSLYSYQDVAAETTGMSRIEGSQMSAEAREAIEKKLRRSRSRREAQLAGALWKRARGMGDSNMDSFDSEVIQGSPESRPKLETALRQGISSSQLPQISSSSQQRIVPQAKREAQPRYEEPGTENEASDSYDRSQGRNMSSQNPVPPSVSYPIESQSHSGRKPPRQGKGLALPLLGRKPPKKAGF